MAEPTFVTCLAKEKRQMTRNPRQTVSADIVVIGAGIAGASVAAELAQSAHVILLEMERHPGYHTTGRSAAMFAPSYGPGPIRALTRASNRFFLTPPTGFAAGDLLSPRDTLMIARHDQLNKLDAAIDQIADETPVKRLGKTALYQHQPLLRDGYASAGFLDMAASEIDVHALHQGYLRMFRAAGGILVTNSEVTCLSNPHNDWQVQTASHTYIAARVVNAAGAWADSIAALAHVPPIGLIPKRRTALIVASPSGIDPQNLPLTVDIAETFYLKPDAAQLLISPADETPSPPCDAQPEELDIALCVDRITSAFNLDIHRIHNKWAGLRSFVPDKSPVVGYAPHADTPHNDGFFWLAGQGGYGIQTAPALARYAAALVLEQTPPADIIDQGLDPCAIGPERLVNSAAKESP